MKQAALQALQHVRTTLAYQLTPEAVSELLEPIQSFLEADPKVSRTAGLHNAKVEEAMQAATHAIGMMRNYKEGCCTYEAAGRAENLALHAIRSLRL
jgi:hypothetical protein